jgi:exonuclease VII large subunit
MDNQQDVIDNAVVQFKSRKTSSIKYEAAFQKALEISNKTQRKTLNEFLDSVTKKGVSEKVAVADPELEEFMKELKDITPEELVSKMGTLKNYPKQIKNKRKRDAKKTEEGMNEAVTEDVSKAIKSLVNAVKSAFGKLKRLLSQGDKAAENLMAVAQAAPE